MQENELSFGQIILISLTFLVGGLLFLVPPSFIPRYLSEIVGPIIAWSSVDYTIRKLHKKEIAMRIVDPNSEKNDKEIARWRIANNIVFFLYGLLWIVYHFFNL
ncbi:MAG: hypothetical protein WCW66_02900 [Patescibacteria group bacterium]